MNFGPFNLDIALMISIGAAGGVLQNRLHIPLGKAAGWILAVAVGLLGLYFVWDCRDGLVETLIAAIRDGAASCDSGQITRDRLWTSGRIALFLIVAFGATAAILGGWRPWRPVDKIERARRELERLQEERRRAEEAAAAARRKREEDAARKAELDTALEQERQALAAAKRARDEAERQAREIAATIQQAQAAPHPEERAQPASRRANPPEQTFIKQALFPIAPLLICLAIFYAVLWHYYGADRTQRREAVEQVQPEPPQPQDELAAQVQQLPPVEQAQRQTGPEPIPQVELEQPSSPLTPQRDHRCETDDGAEGVSFGEQCWPLTTTEIELSDIPYRVRRQITDAAPLAGLTGLQTLDLDFTQVSDLTPLSGLTGLQELSLNFTQVSDLTPLQGLTGLQELSLWNTQVRDLTPLQGMTGLQRLNLYRIQVSDLTPLSGLTGLHRLVTPDERLHGSWRDTPENRAEVARAIRTWRPQR